MIFASFSTSRSVPSPRSFAMLLSRNFVCCGAPLASCSLVPFLRSAVFLFQALQTLRDETPFDLHSFHVEVQIYLWLGLRAPVL